MDERDAYIGFSFAKGIGPLRFKLLHDYFGSASGAWEASEKTFLNIGFGEKLTTNFLEFRKTFDLQKIIEEITYKEIMIVTQIDPEFPPSLLQIPDPPLTLYIKGSLLKNFDRCFGIVGTRKPTPYGQQVTEKITRELIEAGLTIVSGMARGVDGIAHRISVECKEPTIAVLGCGVDIIYPPEHNWLYGKIIETGGAIISEVPPGHTVSRGLFPARNRIISGISRGVLVTEGAEDSGSLITAKLALEQGREVFAIPGPINSYLSQGPTKLIKNGAKLVSEVQDILEELNLPKIPKKVTGINGAQTQEERLVLELLTRGSLHFDDIVKSSHLQVSQVSSILTLLELSGVIMNLGDAMYSLK